MNKVDDNLPSIKPYFIRAWHEWCSENGYTPHIVVAVNQDVTVPLEYVKDGHIVLNTSWDATGNLRLGNTAVEFQARFSGRIYEIFVPVERIQAIFARENGAGMEFEVQAISAQVITNPSSFDENTSVKQDATSTPAIKVSQQHKSSSSIKTAGAVSSGGRRPSFSVVSKSVADQTGADKQTTTQLPVRASGGTGLQIVK